MILAIAVERSIEHSAVRGSWLNPDNRRHVRMKTAIISDRPALLQNRRNRCLCRNRHVPVSVLGSGGVIEHVLIDPLNCIPDFRRHFQGRNRLLSIVTTMTSALADPAPSNNAR